MNERIPEYAPMVAVGDGRELARFASVSSGERERVKARQAVAIEGYIAPESRFKTAVNYLAAGALLVAALVGLACTGPSDKDAAAASARSLQDAQAQARAERRLAGAAGGGA